MAASSLAAARAALLRLAYTAASATSCRPVSASAVATGLAAIRRLAHDAAAAPSSSLVSPSAAAASRVITRGLAHKAAGAAAPSPPTFTVAVVRAVIRGLAHKASTTSSSPPSSSTALLWYKNSARGVSSVAVPPTSSSPPTALSPNTVMYLIDLINGLVLTKEEELMFRKAFNDKFSHFKVSDIISHLESEKFTFEEYCFLLRIIDSKLGPNRELAELILKEDINLSCSNDEIMKNPMLARVETKIDILSKKVTDGNGEILDAVRASNKSDWGSIDILGRKLDLTKLEYIKKVIEHFM